MSNFWFLKLIVVIKKLGDYCYCLSFRVPAYLHRPASFSSHRLPLLTGLHSSFQFARSSWWPPLAWFWNLFVTTLLQLLLLISTAFLCLYSREDLIGLACELASCAPPMVGGLWGTIDGHGLCCEGSAAPRSCTRTSRVNLPPNEVTV